MAGPSLVVGVDFSTASRKAVRGAAVFARAMAVPLVLVHAMQEPPSSRGVAGAPRRQLKAAMAKAGVDEAMALSRWAERLRSPDLEVETVVRDGEPAEVLLAAAKRHRALLVAAGTSGKGMWRRTFLGSTARRVADRSPVPVMLFPERGGNPRRRPGPVVAGIDLLPGCGLLAEAAGRIALDLGAQFHAVHALAIPMAAGPGLEAAGYTSEMLARHEVEAKLALTEITEPLRRDVRVENFVELGDASTALLTHARRVGASCIVTGRRRSRRTGFGRVSLALVQRTDRPLVVVPKGSKA